MRSRARSWTRCWTATIPTTARWQPARRRWASTAPTPARVVLLRTSCTLRAALESALHQRSLPFLAGTRHDACVLLVQAPPADIRAAVDEALAEHPGRRRWRGAGGAGVDAVPDSLRDAEIALERTRADPARRLLAVEDLDLATLIATELSSDRLTPKVDELVGELRANQGLFDAVVAYFEHDLDIMRTSEAMHLHHNSLRYRLGRVEQLLGRSLKDPATIASLYIALAAHGHGRRPREIHDVRTADSLNDRW